MPLAFAAGPDTRREAIGLGLIVVVDPREVIEKNLQIAHGMQKIKPPGEIFAAIQARRDAIEARNARIDDGLEAAHDPRPQREAEDRARRDRRRAEVNAERRATRAARPRLSGGAAQRSGSTGQGQGGGGFAPGGEAGVGPGDTGSSDTDSRSWVQVWDEGTSRYYFWNVRTNEVRWELDSGS